MAKDQFGVLVGWRHEEMGNRLVLKLESVGSLEQAERHDVDTQHFIMTRNQAVVMANYLMTISGQSTALPRKRGRLARWFGG